MELRGYKLKLGKTGVLLWNAILCTAVVILRSLNEVKDENDNFFQFNAGFAIYLSSLIFYMAYSMLRAQVLSLLTLWRALSLTNIYNYVCLVGRLSTRLTAALDCFPIWISYVCHTFWSPILQVSDIQQLMQISLANIFVKNIV